MGVLRNGEAERLENEHLADLRRERRRHRSVRMQLAAQQMPATENVRFSVRVFLEGWGEEGMQSTPRVGPPSLDLSRKVVLGWGERG